jgi:hypothetical protein
MTKKQLAEKLNGRQYGQEITEEEEHAAKTHGLLVIFGYSDDNVEVRGADRDEVGVYDGSVICLSKRGRLLPYHLEPCECHFCGYKEAVKDAIKIKCLWCNGDYSWSYETDLPHETFAIFDGEEKYCLGIVLDIKDF